MTNDWIPQGLACVATALMASCATSVRPGPDAGLAARLMAAPAPEVRTSAPLRDDAPQDPVVPKVDMQDVLRRLDEQDALIRDLQKREADREKAGAAAGGEATQDDSTTRSRIPIAGRPIEVLYDKGFVLRSTEGAKTPFELSITGRMQFRYQGFAARDRIFRNLETDRSGNPIMPNDLNQFEIERGRLSFDGMWMDPDLHFYINLDADTDDNHQVIFHDFWINYDFCEAFQLYVGKAFVPGSRSWLDGSSRTHLADRSMATTFFRPDRSIGIWAQGEPVEDFHYRVMVGNGLSTSDLSPDEINNRLAFAASVWCDPVGDFGKGYADLEDHEDPAVRVGASFMFGEQAGENPGNAALAESRFLRLSDGSRLTSLMVNHYDEYMAAVDAAFKWQGFSIHGEGYFRWLREISPTMAAPAGFPDNDQDDVGFYVDAGFFVIPQVFEPVVRYSAVYGSQKKSAEYACALNWYIDGEGHSNKMTLEAAWLNGVPVSNSGANYRVGDDGFRVMLQWQIGF